GWIRARAEFRSRSKAIVAVAVMIGLAGGLVMAAAAGGRRTESAYPRFVVAQRGLSFAISPSDPQGLEDLPKIAKLPFVLDSTNLWSIPGVVTAKGKRFQ